MSGTTDRPAEPGGTGAEPPDDAEIGAAVRDAAEGWIMPPHRLGQQTWRDRVRVDQAGRPTRWTRRIGAAATTAIAATVILAFGAVWLTSPVRQQTGKVPSVAPSAHVTPFQPSSPPSPSPAPSHGPAPSPLPTYALSGDPLPESSLLVAGEGYRVLDLTTGHMSDSLLPAGDGLGEKFFPAASGGWTCVCPLYDGGFQASTSVSVELRDYDSTGALTGQRPLNTYDGALADPQVQYWWAPISVQVSRADRPDRAFVGWAVRTADGWQSGVDIVDLTSATVVEKIRLPVFPVTDGTDASQKPTITLAQAPTVRVSPSGDRLVIGEMRSTIPRNAFGVATDPTWTRGGHWSVTLDGDRASQPAAMATGEGTLDALYCQFPIDESFVTEDLYATFCSSPGTMRRVDARTGAALGDVTIAGLGGGMTSVVAGPGGIRYAWLPFSKQLVKIDATAGTVLAITTIDGRTAAVDGGPLDGLAALGRQVGRWLAPTTAAKIFLDPAMAISPDGSRLYLLGVDADSFADGEPGSTGVHVVDTGSMTETATWAPLADYASIAVSGDGSLVYVTSVPGFIEGDRAVASGGVIAYDAASGTPRLVAGQLNGDMLLLDPALVP